MIKILTLLLALGLAQTPQQPTPAQLIDQLQTVVKQLQALFPPPAQTPAPAEAVKVSTVAELDAAQAQKAPRVFLNPGTYLSNIKLTYPIILEGTKDAVLVPLDPLKPTITIASNDVTIVGLKWKC